MDKKIIPGQGFDKIKFGMTRDAVIKVLGKPDEIAEDQNYSDSNDANELTTVFYYDELGLSLSFDKQEKYRLTEISFEDADFALGSVRTGMTKKDALAKIEKLGLGTPEEDYLEPEDNPDELELYTIYDANISLWFSQNELTTIQIVPNWIDDDTIAWPN